MAKIKKASATDESASETDMLNDLTYEEASAQLEEILNTLEGGELPLEESLLLYEKGSILATYCAKQLDEAELRVRQWQPAGDPAPFEDWSEE